LVVTGAVPVTPFVKLPATFPVVAKGLVVVETGADPVTDDVSVASGFVDIVLLSPVLTFPTAAEGSVTGPEILPPERLDRGNAPVDPPAEPLVGPAVVGPAVVLPVNGPAKPPVDAFPVAGPLKLDRGIAPVPRLPFAAEGASVGAKLKRPPLPPPPPLVPPPPTGPVDAPPLFNTLSEAPEALSGALADAPEAFTGALVDAPDASTGALVEAPEAFVLTGALVDTGALVLTLSVFPNDKMLGGGNALPKSVVSHVTAMNDNPMMSVRSAILIRTVIVLK